jgi:hypothetical protein
MPSSPTVEDVAPPSIPLRGVFAHHAALASQLARSKRLVVNFQNFLKDSGT